MSILAEPRRRGKHQRLSSDPQNIAWKRDTEKFGQRMIQRMGWSEGKGLGKGEQGITDNIRLRPNYDARGLGCDATSKGSSAWVAHHDGFAEILQQLNKGKGKGKKEAEEERAAPTSSIEEQSKNSRSRIHYKRRCLMKDLQQATDHQKSSIFGGGARHQHKAVVEEEKEQPPPQETKTTVSTLSMKDYFAEKMKLKLAAKQPEQPEQEGPAFKKRKRTTDK